MRLFTLLLLLFTFASSSLAAVIGIDFGDQWFKISLVKPGVPLDIVLNKESKRKTRSIVALRDNIRSFGSEAVNVGTRFPKVTYDKLKNLLGRPFDDELAKIYRQDHPNGMVKDERRGTIAFQVGNETYSIEELVAMQLKHAREQAEIMAGDIVRDAVITIPRFYNQFERQALLDAAELAGLRVLGLIHDDLAVALNYAMNRNFNDTTPDYHIFYDMGAGSTVASLYAFQNVPTDTPIKGTKSKTVPQIEVKAVGYDKTLGGHAFDLRLQRHLATLFDTKNHKSSGKIFENQRAMMKMLNQAERVKEILSANQEISASVENVMDDLDFRATVSRTEFEDMSKDLFDRVAGPIEKVLERTGLKMDDITSVILVGGGTRVPGVQKVLKQIVGEEKIAKNINSDEAAVLGAGFRAAGLSRQFRVRDIRSKDINPLPIEVVYTADANVETGVAKTHHTLLFSESSTLNSKKLMNFRRSGDFDFDLAYKSILGSGDATYKEGDEVVPGTIMKVGVEKVDDALEKFKARNHTIVSAAGNNHTAVIVEGSTKVKATIMLSESGLVSVQEVAAYVDLAIPKEEKSLKDKVMGFFKGKNSTNATESEGEETAKEEEEKKGSKEGEKEQVENDKVEKLEYSTQKIPLAFTVLSHGLEPLNGQEKTASLARLLQMDNDDRHRRQVSELRNHLEGFCYGALEYVEREDVQTVSTEPEREALKTECSQVTEWLYNGDSDQATLAELRAKSDKLDLLKKPMLFRKGELEERPEVVSQLESMITVAKTWLKSVEQQEAKEKEAAVESESVKASASKSGETKETDTKESTETTSTAATTVPSLFTPEELTGLGSLLDNASSWLKENVDKQAELKPHEDPILLVKDIKDKIRDVEREMSRLMKRKRPVKPKFTVKSTETKETSKSTETVKETSKATETLETSTEPKNTETAETKEELKKDEL